MRLNPTRNYVSEELRGQAADGPSVTFTGDRQALESMQQALPAVRALLTTEPPYQPAGLGWQLVEALWNLFLHRTLFADWIPLHTLGHADAVAAGHQRGAARMLEGIAAGHNHRGEHDHALQTGRQALELERRIGHDHGQIAALDVLGVAYLAQGRPAQARGHFTEALSIATAVGHRHGAALMRRHLGECDAAEGHHPTAIGHYDAALQYYQASGAHYAEERVRCLRAHSLTEDGRLTEADTELQRARQIAEAIDAPLELARIDEAQAHIADLHGDDPAITLYLLNQAHARYTTIGHPRAAHIEQRRTELIAARHTGQDTDPGTA